MIAAPLPAMALPSALISWTAYADTAPRDSRIAEIADVLTHAQRHRGVKRRAPASGEGAAA
jgi:hypothetical protein